MEVFDGHLDEVVARFDGAKVMNEGEIASKELERIASNEDQG